MTHDATYFTDRSHLLITGVTGARTDYGGKTTVANYLFDTAGRSAFDLRLFVNVKLDDAPERTADVVCQSVEEVGTAMGEGHRQICLSPTDYDWEAVSRRVRDFIRELPDDMEKFVVLDEAPEMDEEALMWFCRVAGNANNVKTLLLSQNPGDMPSSLRTQVILVWVGPATGNNEHVFTANNRKAHFDFIREEHDPYEWTVMTGPDREDRDHYAPVPEEYA